MRNPAIPLALLTSLLLPVLLTSSAQAQLEFTLTPASQSYQQGQTATWATSFTNIGSSALTFIGISFSSVPLGMTVDDTLYFTNFDGVTLGAGDSLSGDLFTSLATTGLAAGSYDGTITVTYHSALFDTDTDASAVFTSIVSASTSAPEPETLGLLGLGLGGAWLRRRKQ